VLKSNDKIEYFHLFDRDFELRPFYMPPDQGSFVCSQPQSSGMTKCSEIPKLRQGNLTCELDFYTSSDQLAKDPNKSISGCINWNQYYQVCNVSDKNPYSGSISFDNIGLAWVVIFQVSYKFFLISHLNRFLLDH
jgi:voltage-dependent calcium channel T type alpha-1G